VKDWKNRQESIHGGSLNSNVRCHWSGLWSAGEEVKQSVTDEEVGSMGLYHSYQLVVGLFKGAKNSDEYSVGLGRGNYHKQSCIVMVERLVLLSRSMGVKSLVGKGVLLE